MHDMFREATEENSDRSKRKKKGKKKKQILRYSISVLAESEIIKKALRRPNLCRDFNQS